MHDIDHLSVRLGRCPVCGTTVLAEDVFVRYGRRVLHAECVAYRAERRWARSGLGRFWPRKTPVVHRPRSRRSDIRAAGRATRG